MTVEVYIVEIKRPEGVSVEEMCGYIQGAVSTMSGACHPRDPLFQIAKCKVKKFLTEKR